MAVESVMNTGLQGMLASQQRLNESANRIAETAARPVAEVDPVEDLAEPLVQMKIDELVFDASAKVVSTADETLGALLDTMA